MANHLRHALPIALTVTALAAGCGRLPGAPAATRLAAPGVQAHSHALGELELCDPAVARRVDPKAPVLNMHFRPAEAQADGPPKPAVIDIVSPNHYERSGGAADITCIVLHHTSSKANAQAIGGFFSQPSAQVSSHYVVGKDGAIVQSVQDDVASWHAGRSAYGGRDGVNHFSIGIEICNEGNNQDPYTQPQYQAIGQLMAYLMVKYKVGWERVTRHRDVALPKGRKNDTSDNFERVYVEKAVAAAGGPAFNPGPAVVFNRGASIRFPNIN